VNHQIALAGTAEFTTSAERDRGLAASVRYQAATRDGEDGCLAYYFSPDPVVDTRMVVWELWTDEAALAAHFLHPNYLELRVVLRASGIVSAAFTKYRIDLSGPVYDSTRTARAHFFSAGE